MNDFAFPEIDAPIEVMEAPRAPAPETALVLLRQHNLSELSAVDKGLAQLRAEHGSTAYDITTPLGYKLATARRHAVRLVRFNVPKIVSERKAELKALGAELETEAERITAALREIEDPHDIAIKAEDKRKADLKAEEKRLNDERIAKHQAGIEKIRGYLAACHQPGMNAERIARGIAMLEPVTFPTEQWQEFAVPAANAQCETLEAMRALHAQAVSREQEAARQEAIRIENERVAAELAEARRQLEEQAAAVRREQEKLAADRAEAARLAAEEEARAAEQARITEQARQASLAAERAHQSALADALERAETALQPAALEPIVPDDPDAAPAPTLEEMGGEKSDTGTFDDEAPITPAKTHEMEVTLSAINALLGFDLKEAFIVRLGFDPVRYDARKPIYTTTQVAAIKPALIAHIEGAL